MIPEGYITLPEALDLIERCIDEDDQHVLQAPQIDRPRRWAAVQGLADQLGHHFTGVSLYVMRGGRPSDMDRDEVECLVDESGYEWIEIGRVSLDETGTSNEVGDAKARPVTKKYDGCLFLLRESEMRNHWAHPARPESPKSGAPGRPSSMDLILKEFSRRLVEGKTASSRSSEAQALAQWLAEIHPQMPSCGQKTILNKLPPSFQPRLAGK